MSKEINKNFKGLYDTSKTTFITDRTEPTHFYEPEVKTPRIKNVSYSINFDKKELYKQIDDLQQKVDQLEKELKEANDSISWWSNRFKAVERDNKQLENIIKEAINKLKEHKYDLDYEPWSIYKIKGSILFELTETLNKGSE